MKILLWNIAGKPLHDLIAKLVLAHGVDVLILIECAGVSRQSLLPRLQRIAPFQNVVSDDRFGVYTRFNRGFMKPVRPPEEERRMKFWHMTLPLQQDVLLAVVHGWDKRSVTDAETRKMLLHRLGEHVAAFESRLGHRRSLVVGDFNANPFDREMVSADGLHAIPMRQVNGRTDRDVEKRSCPFFFHPMWKCYSAPNGPPATYFRYKYQAHELFWHMIDGVVLRPDLLGCFHEQDLYILTEAGDVPLLAHGLPDQREASDHLPVLFQLHLEKEVASNDAKSLA